MFNNFSLCQVADGDEEEEEDGGDDAGGLPANSNAETVAKVSLSSQQHLFNFVVRRAVKFHSFHDAT